MSRRRTGLLACALLAGLFAWRTAGWVRASRRASSAPRSESIGLLEANRDFYNDLWGGARLVDPERFNTWPLVQSLLPAGPARLEVGPGLRPRLPLAGTDFLDLSEVAARELRRRSGRALTGEAVPLPYADGQFDLVCALDVVEHAEDGGAVLAELARVTRPGGVLLVSVPLYAARWTAFDELVGHRQRYEPAALLAELAACGFTIERSAAYGMQPRWPWLSDFGMRCFLQRRRQAMWYYTHLLMPLGLWLQPPLRFVPGLVSDPRIDEVLLVCRRR